MTGAVNNRRTNTMSRTIRTRVYKFSELSEQSAKLATLQEAKRFHLHFASSVKEHFADHELRAASERLVKYGTEFTKQGKIFHS